MTVDFDPMLYATEGEFAFDRDGMLLEHALHGWLYIIDGDELFVLEACIIDGLPGFIKRSGKSIQDVQIPPGIATEVLRDGDFMVFADVPGDLFKQVGRGANTIDVAIGEAGELDVQSSDGMTIDVLLPEEVESDTEEGEE